MRLSIELTFKKLSECKFGELIQLPYADLSAVAVVLGPINFANLPTLGFLSVPESAPYQKIAEQDGEVLSYGTSWVIQPFVDEMAISFHHGIFSPARL